MDYICDYCGSKLKRVGIGMWKCTKKYCAAEAYEEDGTLVFDDDYNKNGYGYEEVQYNNPWEEDSCE